MRKIVSILALFILTSSINIFSEKTSITTLFPLKYNYLSGKDYRYKKIKKSVSEEYVTFVRIEALDSTERGDINLKYSLDSCTYHNNYSGKKNLSKRDLEKAQVQILFTKSGKELKTQLLNKKINEYLENSGYSYEEKLFELPKDYIDLGHVWITFRNDDNGYEGFRKATKTKIQNLLVGLEQKNNRECYRVDFNGDLVDIVKQGDYTSTEKGMISGSYWIDKQKGIIIAVETETTFNECIAKDPGGPDLRMTPSAPTKTILEFIE